MARSRKSGSGQHSNTPSVVPKAELGVATRSRTKKHKAKSGHMEADALAGMIGKVVFVPSTHFGMEVPGMFYRAQVIAKEKRRKGAVTIKFFEDDGSQCWVPGDDVARWIETDGNEDNRCTNDQTDEYAIECLLKLSGNTAAERELAAYSLANLFLKYGDEATPTPPEQETSKHGMGNDVQTSAKCPSEEVAPARDSAARCTEIPSPGEQATPNKTPKAVSCVTPERDSAEQKSDQDRDAEAGAAMNCGRRKGGRGSLCSKRRCPAKEKCGRASGGGKHRSISKVGCVSGPEQQRECDGVLGEAPLNGNALSRAFFSKGGNEDRDGRGASPRSFPLV